MSSKARDRIILIVYLTLMGGFLLYSLVCGIPEWAKSKPRLWRAAETQFPQE